MSMNVNGSTQQTGTEWFQNMNTQKPDRNAAAAQPPQVDRAVNVTISREGLESLQNGGKARTYEGVMKQKESIIQASKSIGTSYGYRLSEEAGKLKGQRDSGGAYSLLDRAADYVRAYGNLYDEIVQGYKDGTRERYVADENSETGFRKMTMEEELNSLDKAFQKTANTAGELAENTKKAAAAFKDTAEKLSKIKGAKTSFAYAYKHLETEGYTSQENVGQKMLILAQAWKDAYKVSGSKEGGMEKVLSMLDSMFGIKNEA